MRVKSLSNPNLKKKKNMAENKPTLIVKTIQLRSF